MGHLAGGRGLAAAILGLALAGCGAPHESDLAAVEADKAKPVKPVSTRYDLANRCFTLTANGAAVARDGDGYVAGAGSAEPFFMKPSGLGRYIFYSSDAAFLTNDGAAIVATPAPADGADWTFAEGGPNQFTATAAGQPLSTDVSGRLVAGGTPAVLSFAPASGCTVYPEMPTGIASPAFKNRPNQDIIGFAEVHAHMAMGSEMSDGSGNVGPSAGGVMYGQAVNRFGVIEALKDCSANHGPDGEISPEWLVLDGGDYQHAQHDTQGWPTFAEWPQRDSQLHQQMYYKWVERAYLAGLRTMVVHGTNIEALCDIAKQTGGNKDPNLLDEDCTDMGVGMKQVQYLYDIQNYVDAQAGGPDQGWFRIVGGPAEARDVIAQGKLAVIPGLEFSNLFKCNVTFLPDGSEISGCTKDDIDRQIEEIWALGVRAVFPYHDVDSALGGTGIFSSVLNLVGYYGTKGFWKTYPCDDGGVGPTYLYDAGAEMESAPLTQYEDPITQTLIGLAAGRLPVYGPGRQCNARTVTDLGKYAIRKIMEKGFTIDIDHAEIRSKQYLLDEAARLSPNYPMISGHGGHGGISMAQAEQMIRQGGIIYPSVKNGRDFAGFLATMKGIWQRSGTSRPFAVGYGADANGLANLPTSRGASAQKIEYPFTLFQGAGWGRQFRQAGIAPVSVERLTIPESDKYWTTDEHGMAHYGMIADIVEEIRIEGGEEATTAFYNSAEAYLQLWEQTLAASAAARQR
jgi:hypothetical protein